MATIGSLSIHLGVGLQGFTSGLSKAQGMLKGFSSGVGNVISKLTSVQGVVGLIAGGAFAALVTHTMDSVAAQGKLATRLGISSEAMGGLVMQSKVMGLDSENLNKSLAVVSRKLGDVALGSEEAEKSFRRFGLDAKALADMPLDKALGKIFDSINKLPTANERAMASFEIFGKSGQRMMGLISKGSQGMAQATAEAKKFGLAISETDSAKVAEANMAFNKVQAAIEGVWNKIVIALAPAISEIAEAFLGAADDGISMGELVAEGVGTLANILAQAIKLVVDFREAIGGAITMVAAYVAIQWTITTVQKAIALAQTIVLSLSGPKGWAMLAAGAVIAVAGTVAVHQAFSKTVDKAKQVHTQSVKVGAAMKRMGPPLDTLMAIEDLNKKLTKTVATFGMTSGEVAIWELKQKGATDAQLASVKSLTAMAEIMDRHKSIIEDSMTPMDKFNRGQADLNQLLQSGKINWTQYQSGVHKAVGELESASKLSDIKSPKALTQGSSEAVSAVLHAQLNQERNDPQKRMVELLREANAYAKAQTQAQQDTVQALKAAQMQQVNF